MTAARRPWYCRPSGWLAVAVGSHLLCVLLLPRLVMGAAMPRLGEVAGGENRAMLAPPTDADSRRIVMPSPDLRYAVCVYNLADGPLRIEADPRWPAYWSVALYDARTDNYHSRNDRQLAGRPLRWLLVPSPAARPAGFDGEVVVSPTQRGIVLMRLLVPGHAGKSVTVRSDVLRCAPHSAARG